MTSTLGSIGRGILLPPGAVPLRATNRQAAAANLAASASITPPAGRFAYLTFVMFWAAEAAATGTSIAQLSGLPVVISQWDLSWGTGNGDRIIMPFPLAIQGNTAGVAITAAVAATGVSGPSCGVDLEGFYL